MIRSASLNNNPGTTADLKSALQFLNHGTRGYYCQLVGATEAVVRTADLVYLDSNV